MASHRIVIQPLQGRLTIGLLIDGHDIPFVKTDSALVLAETNYPVRFYFPQSAIQSPLKLVAAFHQPQTYCPYKGFASYFDVSLSDSQAKTDQHTVPSLVWSYTDPFDGSHAQPIRNMLCTAAPSSAFQVRLDGLLFGPEQAVKFGFEIIQSAPPPSNLSSPFLSKADADRQRSNHSFPDRGTTSTHGSNSRAGPSRLPHPAGFSVHPSAAIDIEPDSFDPMLADLVYRLDDQQGQEQDQEQQQQHDRPNDPESSSSDPHASQSNNNNIELDSHLAWLKGKPWYKRPSENWLRPFTFLLAMATTVCVGPKLELLNMLVCDKVLGHPSLGGDVMVPQPIHQNLQQQLSSSGSVDPPQWLATLPFQQSWQNAQPVWFAFDSYLDSTTNQTFAGVEQTKSPLHFLAHPNSTQNTVPRRPTKQCFENPQVQSSLASLQLKLSLSVGILAVLTTGYWSNLSSRIGRLTVLRMSILGTVVADSCVIMVAIYSANNVPGGIDFLMVGTTVEGLLGGVSTLVAVHQSYIADATPSGTRAHIFSSFLASFYAGLALGPTLGSILVKSTDNILSPFWFKLATSFLYMGFLSFIIPESTSPEARAKAAQDHKEKLAVMKHKADARSSAELQPLLSSRHTGDVPLQPFGKRLWKKVKMSFMNSILYAPLEPISFVLPKKVRVDDEPVKSRRYSMAAREAGESHISVSHVAPRMRYYFNLFFLSLSYLFESLIMGSLAFKLQYAQEQFLWDSSQLGFYLTFAGVTRVFTMAVILPILIKFLHKPVKLLSLPHDGLTYDGEDGGSSSTQDQQQRPVSMLDADGRMSRSLYGAVDSVSGDTASIQSVSSTEEWDTQKKDIEQLWTLRAKHLRLIHDSKFDLKLTKLSIFINLIAYTLMIFAKSPHLFFFSTALLALGSGGGAAMSSLALALLPSPSDAGKLFGAWSIISSIASTVFGPILFAEVFRKTTQSFTGAIFILCSALLLMDLVSICLLGLRKPISLPSLPARPHPPKQQQRQQEEEEQPIKSSSWSIAFRLNTRRKDSKDNNNNKVNRPKLLSFSS